MRRLPCVVPRGSRGVANVLVASAARTPIGAFCGAFASTPAVRLGAAAMGAALRKAGLEAEEVDLVVMGHSVTAGSGGDAVRQACRLAELPPVECFGVSKGCSSGMKAVILAAQAIAMGQAPNPGVSSCFQRFRSIFRLFDGVDARRNLTQTYSCQVLPCFKVAFFSTAKAWLGEVDVAICGGMESMSQAPYYLRHARGMTFLAVC